MLNSMIKKNPEIKLFLDFFNTLINANIVMNCAYYQKNIQFFIVYLLNF